MFTPRLNTDTFVGRTDSVHPTIKLLDFYFTILHVLSLIKRPLSKYGELLFEDLSTGNRNPPMLKLRIFTGTQRDVVIPAS